MDTATEAGFRRLKDCASANAFHGYEITTDLAAGTGDGKPDDGEAKCPPVETAYPSAFDIVI